MAETTGIAWCDSTVNFWWGCTKVSPGCDHCYAETQDKRFGGGHWGVGAARKKIKSAASLLHRLDNDYSEWSADWHCAGQPTTWSHRRRVFVQSMSDLFDLEVPVEWFSEAWSLVEICDRVMIQIVTKRVSAVEKRLAAIGKTAWPQHAGLIITIVNQDEADRDLPRLIALKEKLGIPWIGLSIEPILGAIKFRPEWLAALAWIIVGGESGSKARPNWVPNIRAIVRQGKRAGVAVFVKQMGANCQDRNDAGFEGCEPTEWPDMDPDRVEHDLDGTRDGYQGAPVRIRLKSRAGSDPSEWPEDLRVQEFPQ